MGWTLRERGFLPTPDPLIRLVDARFAPFQALADELPGLTRNGKFRPEALSRLNAPVPWDLVEGEENFQTLEKLFQVYCYFASAYVHAPGKEGVSVLPKVIALPLVHLGQRLGQPPILAYSSYCLNNWKRLNPREPIALGNLELVQHFADKSDGDRDESWFILVHVDIEARAGAILSALVGMGDAVFREDSAGVKNQMVQMRRGMNAINRTMDRMPEQCSPEVYFRKVRPYIFGFNNLIYEGCFHDQPLTFRGETGAQSSIVPTVLAALGVRHCDSLLTRHLQDMRNYMPDAHRQFIESTGSIRDFVLTHRNDLGDQYNLCLDEVLAFRHRHFEYAVNYIQKKVENPLATGGTPYIPWLHNLIEETETHYL